MNTKYTAIVLIVMVSVAYADLSQKQVDYILEMQEKSLSSIALTACTTAAMAIGTSCSVFLSLGSGTFDTVCSGIARALDLIFFLPGNYNDYYSGCKSAVSLTQSYCQSSDQNTAPHQYLCQMLMSTLGIGKK